MGSVCSLDSLRSQRQPPCYSPAHRALYPHAEDERFTHTLTIALAPTSALRAHDALSRPLVEMFHPLAVAKVLLPEGRFREFARPVLLDIRHPALPLCPSDDSCATGRGISGAYGLAAGRGATVETGRALSRTNYVARRCPLMNRVAHIVPVAARSSRRRRATARIVEAWHCRHFPLLGNGVLERWTAAKPSHSFITPTLQFLARLPA